MDLLNMGKCIFILMIMGWTSEALPLGGRNGNGNGIEVPTIEMLNFMRRFGYLEKNPEDSEALYHESAIIEAIKSIQKFGALNQTGILDSTTVELFTKSRCGVPDIEGKPYYLHQTSVKTKDSHHNRSKRYVFGAKTWNKRNIKYLIVNQSAKVPQKQVERDIGRAFSVWSQYSNLRFEQVEDVNADIIVGFGSRNHGDHYPFDGPGNILAHAFYPYEMGSWGGDVHFDDDENWRENSSDLSQGVDFYSVALHELGHSLGLAHSPIYNSIMFPYYKGPHHNVLDYDDTLAMYNAYLNKKLDDDIQEPHEYEEEEESETEEEYIATYDKAQQTTTTTTTTTTTSATPTPGQTTVKEHNRMHNDLSPFAPSETPVSRDSNSNFHMPLICEGKFDAVCHFNGFVHIFKGAYVWKLSPQYRVVAGYPQHLREVLPFLPEDIRQVDACYERHDRTAVFFIGSHIWMYRNGSVLANSPLAVEQMLGTSFMGEKVDAALLWPKTNLTYVFAGSMFWRYNDQLQRLDDGYPKSMDRWPGIPANIDAAATIPNGKTYFFKDNQYWLYDNILVRPARGYPRRASIAWLGCSARTTNSIPFRNTTTTVSFISLFSTSAPFLVD